MSQAGQFCVIVLASFLLATILLFSSPILAAKEKGRIPPNVGAVLKQHCYECHGARTAEAGLRLDALPADFTTVEQTRLWTKVHDRIAAGEMPPKDSPPLSTPEQTGITQWLHDNLLTADLQSLPPKGSLVLRRLNRVQYENTIRDLLSTNLELQERLPTDGRAFGFDNVGAALSLSSAQVEAYLEAADAALDAVIINRPRPVGIKQRISGLTALNEITHRRNGAIQELEDAAIAFGRNQFYASRDPAPEAGLYRVRAALFAHQSAGEPVEIYVRSIHKTGDDVIGYFHVQPGAPQVLEFSCQLKKDARIAITTYKFGYGKRQRIPSVRTEPGLGVQWVEFEGPLIGDWPPAGHKRLFGDLPIEMVNAYHKIMSVRSEQPQDDARRLLTDFMRRAYRRPIATSDVAPILALVISQLENKQSFEESMRVGYKAILCSPEFLFFQEQHGVPDDFALASRLSYFLWNTLPDEELLKLAERNELSRPATLHAQVERLLNDPRAERFARNFLGQWLDLRLIDFTMPDPKLYPEFDHGAARSDGRRDGTVLPRSVKARPERKRIHRFRFHVPERALGDALRHRRSEGNRDAAGRIAARLSSRRRDDDGERVESDGQRQLHAPGASRRVVAEEHRGTAARSAAAERRSGRARPARREDDSRRTRRASPRRRMRRLPREDRSTRLRAGKFRRHRRVAGKVPRAEGREVVAVQGGARGRGGL